MNIAPTPISILEAYFDKRLTRRTLKHFARVSEDQWVDFAKHYLAQMKDNFVSGFLASPEPQDKAIRLYFEPSLSHEWNRAVTKHYRQTPLLGVSPYPPADKSPNREEVSQFLNPLKKHLLFSNSVYIRDSFYYCFDGVADTVDRHTWRSDPNVKSLVTKSIQGIKAWLPILIELRQFIESKALVFMPYYITPSFPYISGSPKLESHMKRLHMRPDPDAKPSEPPKFDLKAMINALHNPPKIRPPAERPEWDEFRDQNDAINIWLNGRLMGLDPVFPTAGMANWASRLYFEEEGDVIDFTSDMVSVEVLPFGGEKTIHLDDLWKMRHNEEVFTEVRKAVIACREHLQKNGGTSKKAVNEICRSFLRDYLDQMERRSIIRFLEKPGPGMVFGAAVGVAFLHAFAPVGIIAGAVFTPQLARIAQNRFAPGERAISLLQSTL